MKNKSLFIIVLAIALTNLVPKVYCQTSKPTSLPTSGYTITTTGNTIKVRGFKKNEYGTNKPLLIIVQKWYDQQARKQADKVDPKRKFRRARYWNVRIDMVVYYTIDEFPRNEQGKLLSPRERHYKIGMRVLNTIMLSREYFKKFAANSGGSLHKVATGRGTQQTKEIRGFDITVKFKFNPMCVIKPKTRAQDI